LLKRYKR